MQFKATFPILIAHRDVGGAERRRRAPAPDPARARAAAAGRRSSSTTRPTPASSPARTAGWRRSSSAPRRAQDDADALKRIVGAAEGGARARARACRSSRSARARRCEGTSPKAVRGAAQHHTASSTCTRTRWPFLARQIMRAAERLPRQPAAAVLQGAGAPRRALGLLVAHAGPCRRRGLPQVAGRLRAARVLRREHAALGPVDLGARTRLAARPHRAGQGGRGLRGARCSAPTTPTS